MWKYAVLVSIILGFSNAVELPPNFKMCVRTDDFEVFSQCAKRQIENLQPYLEGGIPSMQVPIVDPLSVPIVSFDKDYKLIIGKVTLKNVKLGGLSNFTITDIKVDPDNLKFYLRASLPQLSLSGKYNAQVRIVVMPYKGAGTLKILLRKVDLSFNIQGKEVTDENGVKRIEIESIKTKVVPTNGVLFLKSPRWTTRVAQNVFNANFKKLIKNLEPLLGDIAAEVIQNIVAKSISTFTKDELIPTE